MAKTRWFLNRMQAMSFPELVYRSRIFIVDLGRAPLRSRFPKKLTDSPFRVHPPFRSPSFLHQPDDGFIRRFKDAYANACSRSISEAEQILAGQFCIMGLWKSTYAEPGDWNKDPVTGKQWPMSYFKKIRYRSRDDIGDIRISWELNRFYPFLSLAKAYCITGDPRYIERLKTLLSEWVDQNPLHLGINYISSMEHAIRILQLIGCRQLLIRAKGYDSLMRMIEHLLQRFSSLAFERLALYSSANNHLLVECCSLCLLWIFHPGLMQAKVYARCLRLLKDEIPKQFHEDGVNAEQAIHYQVFAMEAVFYLMLAMKRNHLEIPHEILDRMEKAAEFLAHLVDKNGSLPHFGDSDDAKLLKLSRDEAHVMLLNLAAVLYKRHDFKAAAGNILDEQSFWLLGIDGSEEWLRLESSEQHDTGRYGQSTIFPKGGLTLFKYQDGGLDTRMTFDHGPLGLGDLAAHGHADALSITLDINGMPVLVDPGTYLYNVNSCHRNYFRASENHNTVCLNGTDQSEMRGPFLWGKKAGVKWVGCSFAPDTDTSEALHDGYSPTLHQRKVSYFKPDRWEIDDRIEGPFHSARLTYNLHPDIEVELDEELRQLSFRSGDGFIGRLQILSTAPGPLLQITPSLYSAHFGTMRQGNQFIILWQNEKPVTFTAPLQAKTVITLESW